MNSQSGKQPPALVVIDDELFYEFDQWRVSQGYALRELPETDGWMLRLCRPTRKDTDAQ